MAAIALPWRPTAREKAQKLRKSKIDIRCTVQCTVLGLLGKETLIGGHQPFKIESFLKLMHMLQGVSIA